MSITDTVPQYVASVEQQRDYFRQKSDDALAKLDDARREIERLTAQRDAFRALANMHADSTDARDALANELAELRKLAERAVRAPTSEERQLAASIVCVRLVRPPEPVQAAAEALATCHAAANDEMETT